MRKFAIGSVAALAAAVFAVSSAAAQTATVDVNLAGWQAEAGFGNPLNTRTTITLDRTGLGALPLEVIAIDYIGLEFEALGESWRSEFVLSVNDFVDGDLFWDARPAVGVNSPGVFSGSGTFPIPGLFASGPFEVSAGDQLLIEVYDTFNDPGTDAVVRTGTLRITYQAIPEPAALGLLAGGLPLVMRRRK